MIRILSFLILCACSASASVTLLSGDGTDNRVRLIFLGDGYTAAPCRPHAAGPDSAP